jgi:hypothetical protein
VKAFITSAPNMCNSYFFMISFYCIEKALITS